MRCVIQRVSRAQVKVNGEITGRIQSGYLVLLGVASGDTREMADRFIEKLHKLRIFSDENGKINRSITDVGGQLLVVSQFTLYADCSHGNRPGFTNAAPPSEAEAMYEYFLEKAAAVFGSVEKGIFGADMEVELVNDGPFTLTWDSDHFNQRSSVV